MSVRLTKKCEVVDMTHPDAKGGGYLGQTRLITDESKLLALGYKREGVPYYRQLEMSFPDKEAISRMRDGWQPAGKDTVPEPVTDIGLDPEAE